ncbi:helix-turn-helix transcriptional regulator [Halostella litorea]|uniref:helix-turn-helix transcriptional regulator n=1 Tax=Halostella litorea TaxID=2528831 RepID=UPI00109195F8|nr:ArsR family transcriptional regulator [Halostella litorea]
MAPSTGDADILAVLDGRGDVLDSLREEPKDKRALEADLDVSRSTVDRALRELETAGLVDRDGGRYLPTATGRLLVREYRRFESTAAAVARLEPFLKWVPEGELDLDPRWLTDVELRTPREGDPYAMINRHVEAIAECDRFDGMLPLVGLHAHETTYERVVEDGATVDVVLSRTALETMRTEPYRPKARELLAHDRYDVAVTDEPVPYFLGVFDGEHVQVGVDEDGEPRALAEADSARVVEWAEGKLRDVRAAATPVTADEFASPD